MNIHNKTHTTYSRINCVLKGSSCDTPLPKILMITILATNESSSSTILSEFPHTNDDPIYSQRVINLIFGIRRNTDTQKEEHNKCCHP